MILVGIYYGIFVSIWSQFMQQIKVSVSSEIKVQ